MPAALASMWNPVQTFCPYLIGVQYRVPTDATILVLVSRSDLIRVLDSMQKLSLRCDDQTDKENLYHKVS